MSASKAKSVLFDFFPQLLPPGVPIRGAQILVNQLDTSCAHRSPKENAKVFHEPWEDVASHELDLLRLVN